MCLDVWVIPHTSPPKSILDIYPTKSSPFLKYELVFKNYNNYKNVFLAGYWHTDLLTVLDLEPSKIHNVRGYVIWYLFNVQPYKIRDTWCDTFIMSSESRLNCVSGPCSPSSPPLLISSSVRLTRSLLHDQIYTIN